MCSKPWDCPEPRRTTAAASQWHRAASGSSARPAPAAVERRERASASADVNASAEASASGHQAADPVCALLRVDTGVRVLAQTPPAARHSSAPCRSRRLPPPSSSRGAKKGSRSRRSSRFHARSSCCERSGARNSALQRSSVTLATAARAVLGTYRKVGQSKANSSSKSGVTADLARISSFMK